MPGLLSDPRQGGLRLGPEQLDLGGTTQQDPSSPRPLHILPLLGPDAALPATAGLAQATGPAGPTLRTEMEGPSPLMPGYGFQMSPSPYLSRPNYASRDRGAISQAAVTAAPLWAGPPGGDSDRLSPVQKSSGGRGCRSGCEHTQGTPEGYTLLRPGSKTGSGDPPLNTHTSTNSDMLVSLQGNSVRMLNLIQKVCRGAEALHLSPAPS